MGQYLLVGALILLALIGVPFLTADVNTKELNENTRSALTGVDFVTLSDGVTRYEWAGPASGDPVVFVHGYSSPCSIWDNNFYALADAGFRVLRYDLFGRGFSDRPEIRYDAALFDRQLLDLIKTLEVDTPVNLVGLSMGGAVVLGFLDRHPEMVDKVALFAPAGLNPLPMLSRLVQAPGLGEWIMATFGDFIAINVVPGQIEEDPVLEEEIRAMYRGQSEYRGYNEALVSTLRYGPLTGLEELYQSVGAKERQGLLFWGTEDPIVPYSLHETALAYLPTFEFISIEGGGHSSPFDRSQEVNPKLIEWLRD